jgi:hypothetical protein
MAVRQIFVTIGKNELPCLVSCYRLCKYFLETDREPPELIFVASQSGDYKPIQNLLLRRLQAEHPGLSWRTHYREVDPWNPESIRARTESFPGLLPPGQVHVNYTGGTKTMSRETLPQAVSTSYLAADSHGLRSNDGRIPQLDERTAWPEITLDEIGGLRGFDEIRHDGGNVPPETLRAAELLLDCVLREQPQQRGRNPYIDWLEKTWKSRSGGFSSGIPIERIYQQYWPTSIPWHVPQNVSPQLWETMTLAMAAHPVWGAFFTKGASGSWIIQTPWNEKTRVIQLHYFLDNQFLEWFAYQAFRDALGGAAQGRRVYHSVRFRDTLRMKPVQNFEIDVVGLLGYQVVGVSCALSDRPQTIKTKAFEVLQRARQFGGEHAREVMVCLLDANMAADLHQDVNLDYDSGSDRSKNPQPMIKILGKSSLLDQGRLSLSRLTGAFRTYLRDEAEWKP